MRFEVYGEGIPVKKILKEIEDNIEKDTDIENQIVTGTVVVSFLSTGHKNPQKYFLSDSIPEEEIQLIKDKGAEALEAYLLDSKHPLGQQFINECLQRLNAIETRLSDDGMYEKKADRVKRLHTQLSNELDKRLMHQNMAVYYSRRYKLAVKKNCVTYFCDGIRFIEQVGNIKRYEIHMSCRFSDFDSDGNPVDIVYRFHDDKNPSKSFESWWRDYDNRDYRQKKWFEVEIPVSEKKKTSYFPFFQKNINQLLKK